MQKDELGRLGEILIEQENLLKVLYTGYAEKFPLLESFWTKLADDEASHARVLESVRFGLLDGRIQIPEFQGGIQAVEEQYEMVKSITQGRYRDALTAEKALQHTLSLEQGILESRIFSQLKGITPETEKQIAGLSTGLEKHYREVRGLVLRYRIFDDLIVAGEMTIPVLQAAISDSETGDASVPYLLNRRFKVSKESLLRSMSRYFKVQSFSYGHDPPPSVELGLSMAELAVDFRKHVFVPVASEGRTVSVALEDPKNIVVRDQVMKTLGDWKVEFRVAFREDILDATSMYFGGEEGKSADILAEVLEGIDKESKSQSADPEAAEVRDDDSAIVRLINRMIKEAHEQEASDIHIEPTLDGDVRVRYRIDGVLAEALSIPRRLGNALVSRLKIMADLDIAEKRRAQSGKIRFKKWFPLDIELRVETFSTVSATEDAVLRILAATTALQLNELVLSDHNLARFRVLVENPYGLILCVGPTGSGKTTTLHSVLGHLNVPGVKIITAEDPVEITQPGLRQVQVNPKAGITFASVLRSFLRADPDVLMIGEMRDRETSASAIEASLTGHLVLSTLHTNNAPETITRLLEMEIDRYSFADSLLGILAQRLVRRLCVECRVPVGDNAHAIGLLADEFGDRKKFDALAGRNGVRIFEAAPNGCEICRNTGYRGRLGIHELLVVDDVSREGIYRAARVNEIRELAQRGGMMTLKQDGIAKVLTGLTSIEEVRSAVVMGDRGQVFN
jgi:type II secretory ATPase GspE/PulE/Tfp pilus assembly ATPase PilB-like protein